MEIWFQENAKNGTKRGLNVKKEVAEGPGEKLEKMAK